MKANAMVQIATNKALKVDAPKFNKKKFETAVQYALTLTTQHKEFYPLIKSFYGCRSNLGYSSEYFGLKD